MGVEQHPQLGLELGLVEDVAQEGKVGRHFGGLCDAEVVGQLEFKNGPGKKIFL